MKKYILTILTFLGFLIPFKVSAASFTLSPETLQSLSYGAESLQYGSFTAEGLLPYSLSSPNDLTTLLNNHLQKSSTTTVTNSDITNVWSYDDIPYDIWEQMQYWELEDALNHEVDRGDIRYVTFDNGFYSGECIVDSNGDILYMQADSQDYQPGRLANIRMGGSEVSKSDWETAYQSASSFISNHNMAYDVDDPSSSGNVNSFFISYGDTSYGNAAYAESLYIPNQYLPGQIIPTATYNNEPIRTWYANDLSLFNHESILGGRNTFSVTEGSFSKDGYNYRYSVSFASFMNFSGVSPASSYETWYLANATVGNGLFGKQGYLYNTQANVNKKQLDFAPTDATAIPIGHTWGLDDLENYVGDISDGEVEANEKYDPTTHENKANFPISITIPDAIPSDPPVPGTYEDDDAIPDDPAIPEDLPLLIPEGIPDLPIVSGLENRFPFSIPWDLKRMFSSLRSRPVAPSFVISWYIRPIDYTWNFSLDLSVFDDQAALFRKLFLIAFVIGLAVFSYRHFFGQ